MAKVKVQKITNKNLKTGEEITYLQTRAAGKYDGDDLISNIRNEHGVNKTQVRSSLEALMPSVFEYLKAGNSVEIPGLGTVRPVISSKAVSDPKDATLATIKGARLSVQPCKELRALLAGLEYEMVGGTATEDSTQQEEEVAPGENTNSNQNQGNQQGNQQTPTKYTLTLQKHDGTTLQTLELAAGAAITYPANTNGYEWPASKPATMPAQNTTVREVAVQQQGDPTKVTVTWLDINHAEKKSMEVAVGGSIQQSDIPAPFGSNHWDKDLTQINSELVSATAGSTITVQEEGDSW